MKLREEYTCPLELVQDMIKGKWKCIIIWRLRLGPTSPSKLRRDIKGITEKMLLEQLKELMDFQLVDKEEYLSTYPLRVEYSLSTKGKEVLKSLEIMQRLGIQYLEEKQIIGSR
ncbi:helix-turn-helix transcriptional regulator [Lysinibacillus sphaericus]|uniref:Transcriptional regulator n=6 Tax=Bacillaceae TaxID=186817 RepID=A0A2S0K5V6_LYSSH|nr:transcriptional regulator [Lysinibacillus sphaericus]TKI49015.1 helix-turn-helix transcriptional regulator [Lysinibacillus tabacifolii]TKI63063.1 helix-turn-helix transcriptional regulator [Lysinibacillus varians]TKI72339.1 helix-turn-helix transcriptional regulator [Lysinibacillus mangiferihumi]TKI21373.1 helix-turn-helix transcriptional regulator [Lysinibacillus sphaericus]